MIYWAYAVDDILNIIFYSTSGNRENESFLFNFKNVVIKQLFLKILV